MKRLLCYFILILLFIFTACSNTSNTKNSRESSPRLEQSGIEERMPEKATESCKADIKPEISIKKPEKVRFIAMADSRGSNKGVNTAVVIKTLKKIKELVPQPAFAVMPGDLIDGDKEYKDTKSQMENFKSVVSGYYPPDFFYPGIGNHEVTAKSDGEKAFNKVFTDFKATFLEDYGRTVYYFDAGNTRLFMLNSNHPGENNIISEKQLDWVRNNMDSNKEHNLFFMHEPPYPTGSHVGSSLDANPIQRDNLWQLIDASNGPMVFCGHEHIYSRRHIDSAFNETFNGKEFRFGKTVYQLTVGSFGAPLYKGCEDSRNVDVLPVSQYHFAVVDIEGNKIKVTVMNIDGQVIDSFEQTN